MSGAPTRLFMVEDHTLVRDALVRLLGNEKDLRVVGAAGPRDGQALLERGVDEKPDVLVVGVGLPRFGGLGLLRQAATLAPGAHCVALLQRTSEPVLTQVLGAGALGCVSRDDRYESLLESVRRAAEGEPYVSPRLAPLLVSAVAGHDPGPLGIGSLTRRERQVLVLVAEGLSTREIAGQLGLSPRTVETHRARLLTKLDVRRTSHLVRIAVEEGLLAR